MDFGFSPEQEAIREGVAAVCRRFGDDYWRDCEAEARFPREFHQAMADGGWLGITMPEEYGGAGPRRDRSGDHDARPSPATAAAWRRPRSLHINLFGPHPIVVHGTRGAEGALASRRWSRASDQACFGVTEPDAGLDTTSITTFAEKVAGRLSRQRPEGVDLHRPGGEQDHAADPHHEEGGVRAPDRRHHHLLHRPRPQQDRGAAHPQDGPQGGRIRTRSSSTTCSSRRRTASARKARASPTCWTA